ncbi:MAG: TonB-dependent receptor domain-containing protein [Rhodanobacteraceae bacterium]
MVTGSHIRRAQLATSNPVVSVTAQQIQATGKLTLGSVLQQLPQIIGGNHTPTQDFGGPSGATYVGLRGLGASRTLVLIDGQRVQGETRSNLTDAVDLNSIPAAAIERIDVLTDGASAIYGSDAIGGVINIILKSHYQGAEFTGNYGISTHGDAQRSGGSFIFGQTAAKGSFVAGVSYDKMDPLFGSDRPAQSTPLLLTTGANGARGVAIGAAGIPGSNPLLQVTVPQNIASKFGCASGTTLTLKQSAFDSGTSPTGPSDYQCFQAADNYNYNPTLNLVQEQQRTNAFFNGSIHLSDHVSAYLTTLYDRTTAAVNIYANGYTSGAVPPPGIAISSQSYYNPFGVNFSQTSGNSYTLNVPGPLVTDTDHTNIHYVFAGLRGSTRFIGHHWSWDVGLDYSNISTEFVQGGIFSDAPLQEGAGPSFLNSDGVVQCGTATSPIPLSECTPYDPFNGNSPSNKAAFAARTTLVGSTVGLIQRNYHVGATGAIADLPAGEMSLAVGAAYRQVRQSGIEAPALAITNAYGTCPYEGAFAGSCIGPALNGGFNVKDAYAELFTPLLGHVAPFVHSLNITLGARYSDYSDFGSTTNWKVGLEFRPIKDLLLRGTVSSVFRAPTLSDVGAPPQLFETTLNDDPCDFIAPNAGTPNPNAGNPACVNVPARGTFVNQTVANHTSIFQLTTGAQAAGFPIAPEIGKSFDFGAVYSPPSVKGMTVSADVWRIYLNDVLAEVDPQTELNLCFQGATQYCPLITRVASGATQGEISEIVSPTTNLGRLDVKGLDLSARYLLPFDRVGRFTVQLNASYLTQYKDQTAPGTSSNVASNGAGLMAVVGSNIGAACPGAFNGVCFFPRVRATGMLNWALGPWEAQWTIHFMSRFGIAGDSGDEVGVDRYGSTIYNDLMAGYSIPVIKTTFQVGVDNVFNRQPPLLFANRMAEFNTDTTDFDVIGRYYWVRASVRF